MLGRSVLEERVLGGAGTLPRSPTPSLKLPSSEPRPSDARRRSGIEDPACQDDATLTDRRLDCERALLSLSSRTHPQLALSSQPKKPKSPRLLSITTLTTP